jgi:transcriptional regulator with XRE-family HTH domain
MKQEAFAHAFGVEVSTVSRWERGKLKPSPKVLNRIRETVLRSQSILSGGAIKASHIYKFVVPADKLTYPVIVSLGVAEALDRVGIRPAQITGHWWEEFSRRSPRYDVSAIRALEIIQADEGWHSGDICYAESHCYSPSIKLWVNMMVAPLPEGDMAIIEAVNDPTSGEDEGFWVRLVHVQDLINPQAKT